MTRTGAGSELPRLRSSESRVLGRASLAGEESRIDAFCLERGGPALVRGHVEQDLRVGARGKPAVARHLLIELTFAPARIAERGDPLLRPTALGDCAQDVDRAAHRKQLAPFA